MINYQIMRQRISRKLCSYNVRVYAFMSFIFTIFVIENKEKTIKEI